MGLYSKGKKYIYIQFEWKRIDSRWARRFKANAFKALALAKIEFFFFLLLLFSSVSFLLFSTILFLHSPFFISSFHSPSLFSSLPKKETEKDRQFLRHTPTYIHSVSHFSSFFQFVARSKTYEESLLTLFSLLFSIFVPQSVSSFHISF